MSRVPSSCSCSSTLTLIVGLIRLVSGHLLASNHITNRTLPTTTNFPRQPAPHRRPPLHRSHYQHSHPAGGHHLRGAAGRRAAGAVGAGAGPDAAQFWLQHNLRHIGGDGDVLRAGLWGGAVRAAWVGDAGGWVDGG